jgi:hypothetical protein
MNAKTKKWLGILTLAAVFFPGLSVRAENGSMGKKGIEVEVVDDASIELPDGEYFVFGENFHSQLGRKLVDSQQFIWLNPPGAKTGLTSNTTSSGRRVGIMSSDNKPIDDVDWVTTAYPSAKLKIKVGEMNFTTGGRGDRLTYGFTRAFRNPWNDGQKANEFPLSMYQKGHPFDDRFNKIGSKPFDSQAGLDLGQGFRIDVLFAFLDFKYARYRSKMSVDLEIEIPFLGQTLTKKVDTIGKGFYFDFAGHYLAWTAGVMFAQKDAIQKAFKATIEASLTEMLASFPDLPFVANLDGRVTIEGKQYFLLGTGRGAGLAPGVRFHSGQARACFLTVVKSVDAGSLAEGSGSGCARAMAGTRWIDTNFPVEAPIQAMGLDVGNFELTGLEPVVQELADQVLSKAELPPSLRPKVSRFKAFWQSLVNFATLPYRIWRYYKYDQSLKVAAFPAEKPGLRIAVIDSGIDLARKGFAGAIDARGVDFLSGDSRPYDDSYHGTRIASLIHDLAPDAALIPLKVFNPWGMTNSASIYQAFEYALQLNAKIIVCAWSTSVESQAMKEAIRKAEQAGVVVFVSAGRHGKNLSDDRRYPAAYSQEFSNLIPVAALNKAGKATIKNSAFSSSFVKVATRGENLPVWEPRGKTNTRSDADLAAAVVAGMFARHLTDHFQASDLSGTLDSNRIFQEYLYEVEKDSSLSDKVIGGKVIRE